MFRWKLLNKILPTQTLLYKWKVNNDPMCKHCNRIEDYEHYFVSCEYFKNFIKYIQDLLKNLGYNNEIYTLKNIVIGYKIHQKEYNIINHIITIAAYTMYRAYHITHGKTHYVNTIGLFKDSIATLISIYIHRKNRIPPTLQSTCNILGITQ